MTSTARLLASAAVLIPASLALAADTGAPAAGVLPTIEQGIVPAFVSLVVVGIVFAVLSIKVWPTIGKALDERAHKIRDEIEAAEMARKQAKDALEQYQLSLSQARAEAQKEIDKARAQAQVISAELRAKADVDLAHMREKAMKDIEAARRAAVAELYSEAAGLATTMAGKILRREVSSGDRQKLVDESVAQLQGNRN